MRPSCVVSLRRRSGAAGGGSGDSASLLKSSSGFDQRIFISISVFGNQLSASFLCRTTEFV